MSKPIEIILFPEADKFIDRIEKSAGKKSFKISKQDIEKAGVIKENYFKGLL